MPLSFLINPNAPVPIFQQIADGIRAAIGRGTYAPGELLPSVRQIAEKLGVNPNTVHKAIVAIEREGIIEAERGKGMIVKSGSGARARSASEDAVLRHLAEAAQLAEATGMSEEKFNQLVQRARRDTASKKGDRS